MSQDLKKSRDQLAKGNNGLVKTKFITFGIEADNIRSAKPRLERIEIDLLNNFKRLGVAASPLDGRERLKLMHDMFHMDTQLLINHNFRTTEAEDAMIREKMKRFGITNQSAYLRAVAINGYLLKLDLPEIRELVRLMKSQSNNLNQIARRLNERGSIYETEIDDLQQKQKEQWTVLNKMLSALRGPYDQEEERK